LNAIVELFDKDLIFVEEAGTKEELFRKVGRKLLDRNLVKEGFIDAIIDREAHYPTGLDLSVVGENVPNVAIPHTEAQYCRSTKIVIVKLKNELPFCNMIAPKCQLSVRFLFMILNHRKESQTNLLSDLMSFLTQNIKALDRLETADEIYRFVVSGEKDSTSREESI
jgi:galactose PTS system EIIA component